MNHLKLGIFDLDGTLITLEHDFLLARSVEVLESFGISGITVKDLECYFADHNFFGFLPEEERNDFSRKFWERFNEVSLPPPSLFDATLTTLDYFLTRGWKIAIATARSHPIEEVSFVLKDTGILKYVSTISTWAEEDWLDKIRQIQKVCRIVGVSPAESCMVGDSPTDIISAHGAGSRLAVGVLSGGIREEVLKQHNPHLILPDIGFLPDGLDSLK